MRVNYDNSGLKPLTINGAIVHATSNSKIDENVSCLLQEITDRSEILY
jgi:hypothetical protein